MAKRSSKTKEPTTKKRVAVKSKAIRGGTQNKRPSSSPARPLPPPRTIGSLNKSQKALFIGIGLILFTLFMGLSLISPNQGQLTISLSELMGRWFGFGSLVMPFVVGGIGFYLVMSGMGTPPKLPVRRLLGGVLLFLVIEGFVTMWYVIKTVGDVWQVAQQVAQNQEGGGYLGGLMVYTLVSFAGKLGAIFVLVVLGCVGAVLIFGLSLAELGQWLKRPFSRQSTPSTEDPQSRDIPINPNRQRRELPAPAQSQPVSQPALPLANPSATTSTPKTAESPKPTLITPKPKPEPPKTAETAPPPTPIFIGGSKPGAQHWTLPRLGELLEPGSDHDVNNTAIREQVEVIEHTLDSFGAPATVVEINQGPTITQFGVEPNFLEMRNGKRQKVKVGKIAGLADDLALVLAARSIRIQAPVPGKGYVGIEVPNPAKAVVSLRDVMESAEYQKIKSSLRIGLGQDVAGQPIAADLTVMPHLLIAGTTGSGKSVCVNAIIACLLLQNTPDDLKLVMVDPKRVELIGYNGIPHLAAPVVVDMERVIGTLQWAMREMDNRYKSFAQLGARNITEYNKKSLANGGEKLPYIVIFIDELADLMMLSPEDTERGITRLAQMARATGIHMVIATQRPSVDVVTGLIKANFPARIAFAVASGTDSRVILDTPGAERLLGQGDMLFQSPDAAAPVRAQGCFVSDKELNRVIEYWKGARRFNQVEIEAAISRKQENGAVSSQQSAVNSQPVVNNRVVREEKRPLSGAPNDLSVGQPVVNNRVVREEKRPLSAPESPTDKPPNDKSLGTPADKSLETPVVPKPIVNPPTKTPTAKPIVQPQKPLWEELAAIPVGDDKEPQYEDDLLPEAIELVRKLQKASTSLLQRRFRIGYTRAARLIDLMEAQGVIGPATGTSKAREVVGEDGEVVTEEESGTELSGMDKGMEVLE